MRIDGYYRNDWRGRGHRLSLSTHHEYWAIWISPQGQYKLKITQWRNIQYDGELLHVGSIDSYKWICIELYEQLSLVRLAHPIIVILPHTSSPKMYNQYKRMYLKK